MKRSRGGSLFLLLTPDELLARIATLVPPPRTHALRYHGVFAIDVLACPVCQGRLEVIAFIAEPTVARRILDHLGLASQAPPVARTRAPEELPDFGSGPDYAAADPTAAGPTPPA